MLGSRLVVRRLTEGERKITAKWARFVPLEVLTALRTRHFGAWLLLRAIASPELKALFGWEPDDAIGTRFQIAVDEDIAKLDVVLPHAESGDEQARTVQIRVRTEDGRIRITVGTPAFVRWKDGSV